MALDRDIERELWLEYENHRNIENRNNLVEYYNPFVKVVIAKLGMRHNKYIDYDDLLRLYGGNYEGSLGNYILAYDSDHKLMWLINLTGNSDASSGIFYFGL